MSAELLVTFNPAEGAVIRMLGLVERRGFLLRDISVSQQEPEASLKICVEPRDSGRSLDVVARQLRRLADVRSVSISDQNRKVTQ